ncbi:hypothetical protein Tco_0907791 [Tanacetum coccineum]|uniref:Uncharacterized protein n=1 Tax=Tanacetum coccineum TaxID=301880 RepID=A0ABQ5CKB5_9ASTR
MACIEEIAKDAKLIKIEDQLLVLIKRQVETELMLEEKFRDLCEEVYNFVKESEDVVKEVERLSCKDVVKETVRLLRRGQKRDLYKMKCLQMMVNESHLGVSEKHTFWYVPKNEIVTFKPGTQDRGCGYFTWKDDLIRHLSFSLGPSTPPSSSLAPSIHPSYFPLRSTLNLGKAECSNCNFLAEKIKALETKIKILEGTLEMERHPENHTLESAAILHELYNDIGKLGLDYKGLKTKQKRRGRYEVRGVSPRYEVLFQVAAGQSERDTWHLACVSTSFLWFDTNPGIDDDDDSEGDILPLEELLDDVLFLLPKSDNFTFVEPVATMENNIEELNEDESFDPGGGGNVVLPNVEEDDTFTLTIRTFLPFVTYPEVSLLSCSSGSEDTIFDPGISTFHFSSLKPVAYENPMVIFLIFCFCPKDKGIRGEIPQDHEDPCLFSILQSSGLRSFAYFGILNPDHVY